MQSVPIVIISLFFLMGGLAHFVATDVFVAAMPDYLSFHQELVYISGLFEVLGGCGILVQKTRRFSGYGLMALCIAVFPANLHMALNADQFTHFPLFVLYIRLPMQLLIIGFIAWAIRRDTVKVGANFILS